jgi:acetoacetyl-CoA synthetase
MKRILMGANPSDVLTPSAIDRPDLLGAFTEHARA